MSLFTQSMSVTGSAISTASPWVIVGDDRGAVLNVTRSTHNLEYKVQYSLADPNRTTATAYTYATVTSGDSNLVNSVRVPPPVAAVRVLVNGVSAATGGGTGTLSVQGMCYSAGSGSADEITETADRLFMTAAERAAIPVNVRAYGAVGDGVTDDSAAIAAAFAASASVHFPPGTYLLSQELTLSASPHVRLTGDNATIKILPSEFPLTSNHYAISSGAGCKSVSIQGLRFDGGAAGWHAEATYCTFALWLSASDVVSVRGCDFTEIYGTGIIVVQGTPDIVGNRFYNCGGFRDGGDNYGDAIHLYAPSDNGGLLIQGGAVSSNHCWIEGVEKEGRCGIVVEGSNASEVSVVENVVRGYFRGIHIEKAERCFAERNRCSFAHAPIILADAPMTRVISNVLIADSSTTVNVWNYKYGMFVYTACGGSLIEGNTIYGTTCNAATIWWSDDLSFIRNTVYGDVTFSGGAAAFYGLNVSQNKFFRRADDSDNGKVYIYSGVTVYDIDVDANRFVDVQLEFPKAERVRISRNTFDFRGRNAHPVIVNNSNDISITENTLLLSDGATAQPISSYAVRGNSECSGNNVYCDTDVNLFLYNTSADHNGYVVRQPNYLLKPNRDRKLMTFSALHGDEGKAAPVVHGASAAIPGGYYVVGQIVRNTSASAGGTVEQVCTTAGYSAPAWAGSTAYRLSRYATNDGGKVYVCTVGGTSASSGGPTGTEASITDGTVTWSYVAASAAAVFKVCSTAAE